jgi:hypothetical protein
VYPGPMLSIFRSVSNCCPCLVSLFNPWVGVCIDVARSTSNSMRRARPCLSFGWCLAPSRRTLSYAESKRESAKFTCLCFLGLVTTETNGPRQPKIMANAISDPRFNDSRLVPQSSNASNTTYEQSVKCFSSYSQLQPCCTKPFPTRTEPFQTTG